MSWDPVRFEVTGRVEAALPDGQLVVRLDGASGWDAQDALSCIQLPVGTPMPPKGAHLKLTGEWAT